jgi:hypothetical protein
LYPAEHWAELERFLVGDETDPKSCFRLADDTWEAWQYSANRLPSEAYKFRFNFGGLRSFLKPYIKSYCYHEMIGRGSAISTHANKMPSALYYADRHIVRRNFNSLDDIAPADVFEEVWDAQLVSYTDEDGKPAGVSSWRQTTVRPFWVYLRLRYGRPLLVPPLPPTKRTKPTESADDESKLIPPPVIRQFVNRLALHRDGRQRLNPFNHLRLCVLVLMFCLGRRVGEVLTAPRGSGPEGPLSRYPSRGGAPGGELWFTYSPNKGGKPSPVYISAEWEDAAMYCVRELTRYGDQVREFAAEEERGLLILISCSNWTSGTSMRKAIVPEEGADLRRVMPTTGGRRFPSGSAGNQRRATGLSYGSLCRWLYGAHDANDPNKFHPGVLQEWNITADGSPDGEIYRLKTHQTRHTRETALASDPKVPMLVRQRDLNHASLDMQFAYQHNLSKEHERLMAKMQRGELVGNGLVWLHQIVGLKEQRSTPPRPNLSPGTPVLIDERFRRLIQNSPSFVRFHQVDSGYCTQAQGPPSCGEYMQCAEAKDGGCTFFVTDPGDDRQIQQLAERGRSHRRRQQEFLAAGRTVGAGKFEALARRTEDLHERSLEMRERLKERGLQVAEEGL